MTTEAWQGALEGLVDVLLSAVPTVALVLLVAVFGTLGAFAGRALTVSLVRRTGLEALAEQAGIARALYALKIEAGFARVCGNIVLVAVALITLMALAELVGLSGVAEGIASVIETLPRIITGGVVIAFGLVVADVARRIARTALDARDAVLAPGLVADALYYLILAVFLTSGLTHLGLPTRLVEMLVGLTYGIVLLTVGVSVGVGSQHLVRNVLLRGYVMANVGVGDELSVAGGTGKVASFATLGLTLIDAEGAELLIPYTAIYADGPVRIRREGDPE